MVPLPSPTWAEAFEAVLRDDSEALATVPPTGLRDPGEELDAGDTLLTRAVALGHAACVERLLTLDPGLARVPDPQGRTPLMLAAVQASTTVVLLLLPFSDPQALDPEGRTALMLAALNGRTEATRRLLPCSPANDRTPDGQRGIDLLIAMGRATREGLNVEQWHCLNLLSVEVEDDDPVLKAAGTVCSPFHRGPLNSTVFALQHALPFGYPDESVERMI